MAIIGANGAGKSTLLRTSPDRSPSPRGTIRFDGVDLSGCRRTSAWSTGHRARSRRAADLPEPLGRGEPAHRRLPEPSRATGPWRRLSSCSRSSAGCAALRRTSCPGGEQQCSRDRPGAHGQPAAAPARRGLARSGAGRRQATSTRRCRGIVAEGTTALVVEQDVSRALASPIGSLPARGPRRRSSGRPARSRSRRHHRRVLRHRCRNDGTADGLGERRRAGHPARRALRAVRDRAVAGRSASCGSSTSPTATSPSSPPTSTLSSSATLEVSSVGLDGACRSGDGGGRLRRAAVGLQLHAWS